MSDLTLIGLIGVVLLVLCLASGLPVAFSMMLVGFVGNVWVASYDTAFSLLISDLFSQFTSYPLTAILFFVLMGYLVEASGVNEKIFRAFSVVCGSTKSGLGFATIASCAGFAAICGSSVATAATMGKICIPEMKKRGYDPTLAAGIAAAGGTLGPIIPPSNVFIVYGILAEQSIAKLFLTGIMPGLILAALMCLSLLFILRLRPALAVPGEKTSLASKLKAFISLFEVLLLFTFVVVGLVAGWFVPSQAGAMGIVGALAIGFLRGMTASRLVKATKEGVRVASGVMLLIAGAVIYGHFLGLTEIPTMLVEWVQRANLTRTQVLIFIILFYFVGGCIMDSLGFLILTMPVILPLVKSLNIDLIWFGTLIVLLTEIGTVTPPVGVNVYVVHQSQPDIPMERVFVGAIWFLPAMFLTIVLLILFPEIALFLPRVVM